MNEPGLRSRRPKRCTHAIQIANPVGAVPIAVTRNSAKKNALLAAGAAEAHRHLEQGDQVGKIVMTVA
jgi:NADPH:quinone reductase-like Zn-dependent oxidoreductase